MFEKIKSFVSKAGKKGKAMLTAAVVSVSACAMSLAASAASNGEDVTTSAPDTASMLQNAGEQLTSQFSSMVTTIIPVILGILGSGLVIFGIFALIRLAKKIFGKVAG